MEFLIYNTSHWVDKLSNTLSIDLTKFKIRYRKGDIIQTYEDGVCKEKPSPNSPFLIIKCPGKKIDKKYQEHKTVAKTQKEIDDEGIGKTDEEKEEIELVKVTDRREYYFDLSQISIPDNKVVEITNTQFNNFIKSK